MIGKPKFRQQDLVSFTFPINGIETKLDGAIYIVDAFGTFEQDEEPSYDIEALYNGEIALFKHVRESDVSTRTDFY